MNTRWAGISRRIIKCELGSRQQGGTFQKAAEVQEEQELEEPT